MATTKTQDYTVTVNGITHSVPVPEVFPVAGGPGYVTRESYLRLKKELLQALIGLPPLNYPTPADFREKPTEDTIRIPEGYRLIKDDYTHIFWAIAASLGPVNGKSATISYSKFMNYLKANSELDESKIEYILKSAPVPED